MLDGYKVVIGVYAWSLTGINVFATHLARGLLRHDVAARILLTEHATDHVQLPHDLMPLPKDIPFEHLPVDRTTDWGGRWLGMIQYLEDQAPCIYLPMSDYRHSCVSPKLSSNVVVVGTIQGDDPIHYEHVKRLGRYWNAVVCVSRACVEEVAAIDPGLRDRLHFVPNGVPVQSEVARPRREGPLRVIYHGVFNTVQKQILDIPRIIAVTVQRQLPIRFTIAGDGPQDRELRAACAPYVEQGFVEFPGLVPNDQIRGLLRDHDVYLMTSAFEGMPHAMLEAMAQGCVPIVTDIRSGIREVIRHKYNGLRVPVGDVNAFADCLEILAKQPDLLDAMGHCAYETVRGSAYDADSMVVSYMQVFQRAIDDQVHGRFQRPARRIAPPPESVGDISIFPARHSHHVRHVERTLNPRVLGGFNLLGRLADLRRRIRLPWRVKPAIEEQL